MYLEHMKTDIDKYFVKDEYRPGQKECIKFIIDAFNNGKEYVIVEAPTGSGKTAIAMTVAKMLGSAYYLTSTKQLQDQLSNEFGKTLASLKGKNAYPCDVIDRHRSLFSSMLGTNLETLKRTHNNCSVGLCKLSSEICNYCFKDTVKQTAAGFNRYSDCDYHEALNIAKFSKYVTMNYNNFLCHANYTSNFSDIKDLLILDEGHNAEGQLLDFMSLTLNDQYLRHINWFIPKFDTVKEYYEWLIDSNFHNSITSAIATMKMDKNSNDKERLKLIQELEDVLAKYNKFINTYDTAEWVFEYRQFTYGGLNCNSVVFKPIFVNDFSYDLMFKHSKFKLIMSATILDVNIFKRSLGISDDKVAAIRLKNRFDVKNRPIYFAPVAKMVGGKDKSDVWMPKLAAGVDKILKKYPDKKGIIHTHNFAIMDYLNKNCKYADRFINQRDFNDKSHLLKHHSESDNSVIIAPAMHEGVDLFGDLSRFQIICKVPYANFYDDKQLKRRIELDNRFYTWQTACKLLQSIGRSVRSVDDYADTYVLDESFDKFIKDAGSMIPSWFKESVIDWKL